MENIKKVIGKRINGLLNERNMTQKELAKYLNVTDNTISYFVNGSRLPNIEQIIKIANYFSISTDFLLGRTENRTTVPEIQNICNYTGLSDKSLEGIKQIKNDHPFFMQLFNSFLTIIDNETSSMKMLLEDIGYYILSRQEIHLIESEYLADYIKENNIDLKEWKEYTPYDESQEDTIDFFSRFDGHKFRSFVINNLALLSILNLKTKIYLSTDIDYIFYRSKKEIGDTIEIAYYSFRKELKYKSIQEIEEIKQSLYKEYNDYGNDSQEG